MSNPMGYFKCFLTCATRLSNRMDYFLKGFLTWSVLLHVILLLILLNVRLETLFGDNTKSAPAAEQFFDSESDCQAALYENPDIFKARQIEIDIRPLADARGGRIRIPGVSLRRELFDFDGAGAVCEWISRLPFGLAQTTIHIYAPPATSFPDEQRSGNEPASAKAGLIILWDRINKLVDMLGRVGSVESLVLMLHSKDPNGPGDNESKSTGWHGCRISGRGRISLNLRKPLPDSSPPWLEKLVSETKFHFGFRRTLYNHEVVMLPFCRLRNVRHLSVTPPLDLSSPWMFLNFRLYRLALSHFFNSNKPTPAARLAGEPRAIHVDRMLDIFERLITEINTAYHFSLEGLADGVVNGMERDLHGQLKRKLLWRSAISQAISQTDEKTEEKAEGKYKGGYRWIWPDVLDWDAEC
ncbi:uncharacterized protein DSM5745_00417 [Aspergillus mulundensis]|uniref:Uncharacterized protein n=1 Tax=Aspergillus mulundensis TaxID=1810919 RepID=A0A3D8T3F9_9EURO|nr:hypothetical protein DSM5745_00417 [Aspergillus mulundensis]RDW93095.1 hypothetical protein DSM5745_00417 [Aspergillus mulundensis]